MRQSLARAQARHGLRRILLHLLATTPLAVPAFVGTAIIIEAPTSGQPLMQVRPKLIVSYSGDDPAVSIDPSSLLLSVTQDGRAVESTVDASQTVSSFVPTRDISAGILTISASIAGTVGVRLPAERFSEVLPPLEAPPPTKHVPGGVVDLTPRGLDHDPRQNAPVVSSRYDTLRGGSV